MIEQLVADANAVIDLMRHGRVDPHPLHVARRVFLPLPVLGELLAGAYASRNAERNVRQLCLQHDLPLLTNDRGFDAIPNLAVIHW